MRIKRFNNFKINESNNQKSIYKVLDNPFLKVIAQDAGVEFLRNENPDELGPALLEACKVFFEQFTTQYPKGSEERMFFDYLHNLCKNEYEYKVPASLSESEDLDENALHIFEELVSGRKFYIDKFLEGAYEEK